MLLNKSYWRSIQKYATSRAVSTTVSKYDFFCLEKKHFCDKLKKKIRNMVLLEKYFRKDTDIACHV